MKKIFFLLISSFSFAQNTSEKEIIKPIETLFNAMKSADSLGVKNAFSGSAIMQTFGKNQEIRTDKVEDFAKQVGASQAGDLDERFTISKVLVDGNMASVGFHINFITKEISRIAVLIAFNWRKSITNGKFNTLLIPDEKRIA